MKRKLFSFNCGLFGAEGNGRVGLIDCFSFWVGYGLASQP